MPQLSIRSLLVLAGLAAAPQAVFADAFPSLLTVTSEWKVTTTGGWAMPSKCKIYTSQPEYGSDGRCLAEPFALLDNANDSKVLTGEPVMKGSKQVVAKGVKQFTPKNYWLVYFPKLGAVRVELSFQREGSRLSTAKLLVGGVNLKDTAEGMPTCEVTSNRTDIHFNKEYFMKGMAAILRLNGKKAFIVMD